MLKTLSAAAVSAIGVATASRAAAADSSGKVLVCHHTGSATNPYVLISVSTNAAPTFAAQGDTVNVNLQTDPNNCGSCGNVCTTSVANATATCNSGTCGYTCNSGYHDDGNGGCAADFTCPTYDPGTPTCFWLDCFDFGPGHCCWTPTPYDESTCQYEDSCGGGAGGSGGGCYMWANSSAGPVIAPPWP